MKRARKQRAGEPQLQWFPLRASLRGYKRATLFADLRGGLNVALLALPQGMAYALIAGIPIQYGIFGSAVAAIFGAMFASSRFLAMGPTNATAIMLASAFVALGPVTSDQLVMLPLLLCMVGLILIVGAYLKVANLVQYISVSVVTGYITAAACIIVVGQVKNVLGFTLVKQGTTFFEMLWHTLLELQQTHWPSLVFGLLTLAVFWTLSKLLKGFPIVAMSLIIMSIIGYVWNERMPITHHLVGFRPFDGSDWQITLPWITFETINLLAPSALAIAFITVLEGVSIGKSLAARSGEVLDVNQEMFSMGIANLSCGLLSGMPASGSLTRSVLNWSSGAATQVSGMITGTICVIGALALGPFMIYLPKTVLAVLVIRLGISLINFEQLRVVMKTTKSDAVVFSVTFISALVLRLDTAILFGASLAIILFLRKASSPELIEYGFTPEGQLAQLVPGHTRAEPEVSIVHVEGNLYFGAAELFRNQMRRVAKEPSLQVIILKMRNAHHLDATSVLALEELVRSMRERGRTLLVSEIRSHVFHIFRNSGLLEIIGTENLVRDSIRNPNLSTAKAVKRAREIIGQGKAKVRIYALPT